MEPYIDFAFVKEHADIRAILPHYGVAVPANSAKNIKIRCLFHEETHASLSINLERKVFHCFGCGAKGDVLEFVRLQDGGDLRQAARLIAELSNIPCAPARPSTPAVHATRAPQKPPGAQSAAQTMQTLPHEQPCTGAPPTASETLVNPPLSLRLKLDPSHPYLAARGLTPETIATFGLGYASRGLLKGRIAIPIHNERGELVAYAGRWPGQDGWPQGEDKYKLPEGFKKSHMLFNLHRLLDGTGQVAGGHLVVVEGYFGTIALHTAGFPAVALMGRTIAAEQVALLHQVGAKRLTLLLDGDEAGRASAAALVPHLAQSFFVRDVVLSDGLQPDALDPATLRTLLS